MRDRLSSKGLKLSKAMHSRSVSSEISPVSSTTLSSRLRASLLLQLTPLTLIVLAVATQADEPVAAFSMSVDEFSVLSVADQQALLRSAFEYRLQHAKNIHYEALQLADIVEHDAAVRPLGKVLKRLSGSRMQHWVLEDSFRMDTICGGPDVESPQQFVASNFDAGTGVAHSAAHRDGREGTFGRIDTKPDRINNENLYARWLDGELKCDNDSLTRYLLKYSNEFTIEASRDEKLVRLSVPWHYRAQEESRGTRVFFLDPEKGFLPVHGISRWELSNSGKKRWRLDEFFVEESRLVGDVWMPTKLKWVIDASSVLGNSAVYHITVEKIEADTTTPKDLEVAFEPGTQVVDAIKGEVYVIGKQGGRTNVEPLASAAALKELPEVSAFPATGSTERLLWLILGNVVVLAAAIFVRLLVKRRAKTRSGS